MKNFILLAFLLIVLSSEVYGNQNLKLKKHQKVKKDAEIMVGGWEKVDMKNIKNDQEFQRAIQYIKKHFQKECPDNAFEGYEMENVIGAAVQVVAGLNYIIDANFVHTGDKSQTKQVGSIAIWMHPLNSQTGKAPIEITDCKWFVK